MTGTVSGNDPDIGLGVAPFFEGENVEFRGFFGVGGGCIYRMVTINNRKSSGS